MKAFLYGACLQWRLDLRSRTLLIACYIVPLAFFAVMGGIFTAILPEARRTLIQSMTVFGATMGALIGLPPTLTEIYGSDIRKVYQANGIPAWLALAQAGISAFIHLFIMSVLLYIAAPVAFGAEPPANAALHFCRLAVFLAASLTIAAALGLTARDQGRASVFSMLAFLPSILLSGIMFPAALLPPALRALGKLFPATWGYALLTDGGANLWPLLGILLLSAGLCAALLRRRTGARSGLADVTVQPEDFPVHRGV